MEYVTQAGKQLEIIIDPKTAFRKIKFVGGGELPEFLQGLYNSEREAVKDINIYLESNKKKSTKKE